MNILQSRDKDLAKLSDVDRVLFAFNLDSLATNPDSNQITKFQTAPCKFSSNKQEAYNSTLATSREILLENRSYMEILMKDKDSQNLLRKFVEEPSYLKSSDAKHKDFSFSACLRRLKIGYTMIGFNYRTAQVQEVSVAIDDSHFIFVFERTHKVKVHFKEIKGILLNAQSSTFKKYTIEKGNLSTLGLEGHDCFSILTNCRSFDMASVNNTIKYDIFIGVSWIISEHSRVFANKIMTKSTVAMFMVKSKLKEIALEKSLFLKELLLLGIAKSLILKNEDPEKIDKIARMLDGKFSCLSKVYRACAMSRSQYLRIVSVSKEREFNIRKFVVTDAKRIRYIKEKKESDDRNFTVKVQKAKRTVKYTEIVKKRQNN